MWTFRRGDLQRNSLVNMANFFVNSQTLLQFTKSLVKCTDNSHVEVNDIITWYKANVGIGRLFFVNSLCKSAIVTL